MLRVNFEITACGWVGDNWVLLHCLRSTFLSNFFVSMNFMISSNCKCFHCVDVLIKWVICNRLVLMLIKQERVPSLLIRVNTTVYCIAADFLIDICCNCHRGCCTDSWILMLILLAPRVGHSITNSTTFVVLMHDWCRDDSLDLDYAHYLFLMVIVGLKMGFKHKVPCKSCLVVELVVHYLVCFDDHCLSR